MQGTGYIPAPLSITNTGSRLKPVFFLRIPRSFSSIAPLTEAVLVPPLVQGLAVSAASVQCIQVRQEFLIVRPTPLRQRR